MGIDTALEAHAQLAECGQPSVDTLDYPAMLPEPVVALHAAAGIAWVGLLGFTIAGR